MHIQSNILTFYKDIGDNPLNKFPEGTAKIRIELIDTAFGCQWKIRCYDQQGNRLDSLKLIDEQ
ncbi:MAG: hypothetical protein JWN75_1113 [Candidatus Saccharibacteria bacterium]|nr:hypothetical protein [Candidatus Saccharibacteria bacterium]